MSTKKIMFGIIAGFTAGTIFGIMLTSVGGVTMRKKILAQGEDYLDTATKKFNDRLSYLAKQLDCKLEKQAHVGK